MAVLYPKIVNAYSKFAQNYEYYKRNFSLLPSKQPTLLAKNGRIRTLSVWISWFGNVSHCIAKPTWPYRESTGPSVFCKHSGVLSW